MKIFMDWNFSKRFYEGYSKIRKNDLFVPMKKNPQVLFAGKFKEEYFSSKSIFHVHSLIKSTRRINIELLKKNDISLTNSFGTYGNTCSEYLIWALLSTFRNFKNITNKKKDKEEWSINNESYELSNKNILLVGGNGEIGNKLIDMLSVFNSNVFIYDLNNPKKDLMPLISRSDAVICLINPTNTQPFFDGSILNKFNGQIFIDISRGTLTDFNSLYFALTNNKISKLVLDVFPSEPPNYSHPIFSNKNLIYTPHISGVSLDWEFRTGIVAGTVVKHFEENNLKKTYHIDGDIGYNLLNL